MIYTITLNPSIDHIIAVKDLKTGGLNYMDNDLKLPGGKGINVSRILQQLNTNTTALGFLGGFAGAFISNWLKKEQIKSNFISINDETRINIKLKSEIETEINGHGPAITSEEAERFLKQLEHITSGDTVILSGSKPPALPDDFYGLIIDKIIQKKAEFVIDTTGDALKAALPYKPLLVKPNSFELAQLFNVHLDKQEDIIHYGRKLLEAGAQHVIVSLAGDGAIFITANGIYHGMNPKGTVKNSVGAGDSMIAGFIGAYMQRKDPIYAFKMGIASGSATAFSDDLAKKEDIFQLFPSINVTTLL